MPPGVVVSSVLLASDQLLRVEQLTIGSNSNLVNDRGFEVNKDSSRNMLPRSSLSKEGVEGVISSPSLFVRGHGPIRLDPVLQTVELPAGIPNLAASLANVDRDTLTLNSNKIQLKSMSNINLNFLTCILDISHEFYIESFL